METNTRHPIGTPGFEEASQDEVEFTARFIKEVKRRSEHDRLIPAKKVHARFW